MSSILLYMNHLNAFLGNGYVYNITLAFNCIDELPEIGKCLNLTMRMKYLLQTITASEIFTYMKRLKN